MKQSGSGTLRRRGVPDGGCYTFVWEDGMGFGDIFLGFILQELG
jgi:hypothetical protein